MVESKAPKASTAVRVQNTIHKLEGRLTQHYKMGKVIFQNGSVTVKLCIHIATMQERAAKMIEKSTVVDI